MHCTDFALLIANDSAVCIAENQICATHTIRPYKPRFDMVAMHVSVCYGPNYGVFGVWNRMVR
jgi:hypothetical protein